MDYGMTENALSLSMNEDYLLTFLTFILVECTTEDVKLIIKNVRVRHSGGSIQQFIGMKVDNYFIIAKDLFYLGTLALSWLITADERLGMIFLCLLSGRSQTRGIFVPSTSWPSSSFFENISFLRVSVSTII